MSRKLWFGILTVAVIIAVLYVWGALAHLEGQW